MDGKIGRPPRGAVDTVFVGVFECIRHRIPADARIQEYSNGEGRWAFALCQKPAWEPDLVGQRAVRYWAACEECERVGGYQT